MSIFNTYWKRRKKLRGEYPDVYSYDKIPDPLRVQIVQIMMEVLGDKQAYHDSFGVGSNVQEAYRVIVITLRKEIGAFRLPYNQDINDSSYIVELVAYILSEQDTDQVLSAIELICRVSQNMASDNAYRNFSDAQELTNEAIREVNTRFKEHGLGYEYDGEIIRIDAELIHAEVVRPALALLQNSKFAGSQQEFLNAYEHYRKGNNKEALNDALKAFESTMKTIFERRKWAYNQTDTASKLIKIAFDNGLVPSFWESQFSGLRTTLEAGIPTARNKLSGHGQGSLPADVPNHLTAYVLHMTASAIVFLIKSDEALK
jgi:AbiJ N-terminal domain 4